MVCSLFRSADGAEKSIRYRPYQFVAHHNGTPDIFLVFARGKVCVCGGGGGEGGGGRVAIETECRKVVEERSTGFLTELPADVVQFLPRS